MTAQRSSGDHHPRRTLLALFAGLGTLMGLANAVHADTSRTRPAHAANPLPTATALPSLLARTRQGLPLVALFSRADCPWCEALRREQLIHLARDAHARGVQVVEFDIGDTRPFKPSSPPPADQAGAHAIPSVATQIKIAAPLWAANSPADLARQMGVQVVPTVVFMGAQGELAQRIVGYASRDFYGAYLAQRIDEAQAALRSQP